MKHLVNSVNLTVGAWFGPDDRTYWIRDIHHVHAFLVGCGKRFHIDCFHRFRSQEKVETVGRKHRIKARACVFSE